MKVLLVLVQVAWAFGLTGAALECPTLDELGECTCIPNTAKLYCGPKTTIFTDLQNEVTFDSIVLEGLENPATINLNKAKTKALTIKDSNLDDFAKIFTANIVEVLAKISLTNVHKDDNKTKILVNDILENIVLKPKLAQITSFELISCELDSVPELATLTSLQSLSLKSNKITKIAKTTHFQGIETLTLVNLEGNTINEIIKDGLSFKTKNPLTVYLGNSKINVDILKQSGLANTFNSKPQVTKVYLNDNKIDKLPLDPFGKYGEKDAIIKIYLDHDTIQCTWLAETSVAWIYDGNHPTASTNLIHVDCNNYQNRDLFQMQPDDFTDHPVTTPTPEPYTGPSTTPPTTPTPEPSQVDYQIDQGWQQITANNWPYMDNEDSINKQHTNFFFIKPNENGFEKVKADLLSDPKQIVKYPVKLSFKFWSYERNVVTVDIDKVTQGYFEDYISDEYKNFEKYWLYREYILTKEQLVNYDFNAALGKKSIIALKDIRLDYQYEDKTTGNNYGNISNQVYYLTKELTSYKLAPIRSDITTACLIKKGQDYNKDCFSTDFKQLDKNPVYQITVDELKQNDVCFDVQYFATKESSLSIHYNLDQTKFAKSTNKMHTIMTKVSQTDKNVVKRSICLRELIAFSASKLQITFVANVANDDELALSIEQKTSSSAWSFTAKNFISKFNDDWKTRSSTNEFELKVDQFHFTGGANINEAATSAYLIGPWVKNSPTLGPNGLAEYSVTVKEEKIFNSFTIRPKICTDLSQCFDVNTLKITPDTNQTTRVYTFNFDPIVEANYVRLMFFVDYFKPENFIKTDIVEFDIKLLNFGDPTYGPTVKALRCSKVGTNISAADPTKDLPNVCKCLPSYYGNPKNPRCELQHYCADKQPGKEFCSKLDNLDCYEDSIKNSFACVCNNKDKIIWDSDTCKTIEVPILQDWKFDQDAKGYYPTKTGNSLTYTFKNVITDSIDVCFTLGYTIKNKETDHHLTISYIGSDSKQVDFLKSEAVKVAVNGKSVKYCIRDLVYKPSRSFTIKINSESTKPFWDKDSLTINSFIVNAEKIVADNVQFIDDWATVDKTKFNQKWHSFKEVTNVFVKNSSNNLYTLKVVKAKKGETHEAYFVSDWINAKNDMTNLDHKITISTSPGIDKSILAINTGIVVENKPGLPDLADKIEITAPQASAYDIAIKIDDANVKYFKIFFKFALTPTDDAEKDYEININSMSVYDPCSDKNKCSEHGTCSHTGDVSLFRCDCTDKTYSGPKCDKKLCDETDRDKTCGAYPNIPTLNPKTFDDTYCVVSQTSTLSCSCPVSQFNEYVQDKQCVEKHSYKDATFSCTDNKDKCPIFDLASPHWWNSLQLDHKTQIFPLYSPSKVEDIAKIHFQNVLDVDDVCFTLNYYKNDKTNLYVKYANKVAFKLMRQADDTLWNKQQICVSDLVKSREKAFDISFEVDFLEKTEQDLQVAINVPTNSIESYPRTILTSSYLLQANNNYDKQWPIVYGVKENWNFLKDKIEFKTATKGNIPHQGWLISQWIEKSDANKIRFNLKSQDKDGFVFRVVAFDESLNAVYTSKNRYGAAVLGGDKDSFTKPVVETITIKSANVNYFKIGLEVTYLNMGKSLFSLDTIDINDPCVLDDLKIVQCSGEHVAKDAKCQATDKDKPKLHYECKCESDKFEWKEDQVDHKWKCIAKTEPSIFRLLF